MTPETLTSLIDELKDALAAEHAPVDKEQKKQRRQQKKQITELEKHRDRLDEYDSRLTEIGARNTMSKTDPDASFMRMKEDAMNNGQTKLAPYPLLTANPKEAMRKECEIVKDSNLLVA